MIVADMLARQLCFGDDSLVARVAGHGNVSLGWRSHFLRLEWNVLVSKPQPRQGSGERCRFLCLVNN